MNEKHDSFLDIIRNFANKMKKVLILCTGNSCRSKMAQACLQHLDAELCVRSAGTYPAPQVHPLAIEVMKEAGMPISDLQPHNVKDYLKDTWDAVITVCDHAREACPVFTGKVKRQMHISIPDSSLAKGSIEEQLSVFREVRDRIIETFNNIHHTYLDDHGQQERL
jgi:arsenate reductase